MIILQFTSGKSKTVFVLWLLRHYHQWYMTHCILKSLYLYKVVSINRSKSVKTFCKLIKPCGQSHRKGTSSLKSKYYFDPWTYSCRPNKNVLIMINCQEIPNEEFHSLDR